MVTAPLPAREHQAPILVPYSHPANTDGGAVATLLAWKPSKPLVVDRVTYLNVTGLAEHASNWALITLQKTLVKADVVATAAYVDFGADNAFEFPASALGATADHGFYTGDGPMRLTTSDADAPAGLATGTDYYMIRNSRLSVSFATTRDNALRGTAINITDAGTGTHTIVDTATSKRVVAYKSTDADLPGANGIAANTVIDLTNNGDTECRLWDTSETMEFLADEAGTTTLPTGSGAVEGRYVK